MFSHLGGEKAGMGIGQTIDLRVHGRQHIRVGMAQAGHGRTPRRVQVALAMGVIEVDPFAANRCGRYLLQLSVHDMGGGGGHENLLRNLQDPPIMPSERVMRPRDNPSGDNPCACTAVAAEW